MPDRVAATSAVCSLPGRVEQVSAFFASDHRHFLPPQKGWGRVTAGYTSPSRSKRDGVVVFVCRIGFRHLGFRTIAAAAIEPSTGQCREEVTLRQIAHRLEYRKLDATEFSDLVLIAVD